jgi:hypothetical protein
LESQCLLARSSTTAFKNQPYADLFFLCGTLTLTQTQNGDVVGEVTRFLTVKQSTAFFFPPLNSELDNVCNGPPHLGGHCVAQTSPHPLKITRNTRRDPSPRFFVVSRVADCATLRSEISQIGLIRSNVG